MSRTYFFLLVLFPFSFLQAQDPKWGKESESDGVFTKLGTDPSTGFPMFESYVTIAAGLTTVQTLIQDYDNLQDIVYGVTESKKLEVEAEGDIVYYELDLPWPVSDRYGITQEIVIDKAEYILIEVDTFNMEYEPDHDLEILEYVYTNWELYPESEQQTKVVYRSIADPMGIPNWVVKLFMTSSPRETLKNLRAAAEEINEARSND